jgi:hypothetical protein
MYWLSWLMSESTIPWQYHRSVVGSQGSLLFIALYLRTVPGDARNFSGESMRKFITRLFREKNWSYSVTRSVSASTAIWCPEMSYTVNFLRAHHAISSLIRAPIQTVDPLCIIINSTLPRRWILWEGGGHRLKASWLRCGKEDHEEDCAEARHARFRAEL